MNNTIYIVFSCYLSYIWIVKKARPVFEADRANCKTCKNFTIMNSKGKGNGQTVRIGIGVFGYVIHDALPDEFVELTKGLGTHHVGDAADAKEAEELGFPYLDQSALEGTYYSPFMVQALLGWGFEVLYLNERIYTVQDIEKINDRNVEKSNELKDGEANE